MNSDSKSNNSAIIDHRSIGQRIREEREKLALSRSEFAEIVELSDYYLGQLERGERQMSLPVLLKISSCLHVSMDYLLLGAAQYNGYPATEETITPFESEKTKSRDIMQLIDKCSDKELALIKKLIQTVLPYLR